MKKIICLIFVVFITSCNENMIILSSSLKEAEDGIHTYLGTPYTGEVAYKEVVKGLLGIRFIDARKGDIIGTIMTYKEGRPIGLKSFFKNSPTRIIEIEGTKYEVGEDITLKVDETTYKQYNEQGLMVEAEVKWGSSFFIFDGNATEYQADGTENKLIFESGKLINGAFIE